MQSPAASFRDPQLSPPPLPLTSATVVCRSRAVEALPHVVERISGFLDCATPELWSLVRACERSDIRLLRRVAATRPGWSSPDVDQHYKEFVAVNALVTAVRNEDRAIVSWLCFEYCLSMIPMKGIDEAARLGKLTLLGWFFAHHTEALWGRRIADAAIQHGYLEVL